MMAARGEQLHPRRGLIMIEAGSSLGCEILRCQGWITVGINPHKAALPLPNQTASNPHRLPR